MSTNSVRENLIASLEFNKLPQYTDEEWEIVKQEESEEVVLIESNDRLNCDPTNPKFPILYKLYKEALASTWFVQEVLKFDINVDIRDWKTRLSPAERRFFKYILAFFSCSDGLVTENIAVRFLGMVQIWEARSFYCCQLQMESVHGEQYNILLCEILTDRVERLEALAAIDEIPAVKLKAEWIKQWISADRRRATERLVAFCVVEGLYFSASFSALFWLRESGRCPCLCSSNVFIAKDENLHTRFGTALYLHFQHRLPPETVSLILKDGVRIEQLFINDALDVANEGCSNDEDNLPIIGLTKEELFNHAEFCSNDLFIALGYKNEQLLYPEATDTFPYVKKSLVPNCGNFFEVTVTEYTQTVEKYVPSEEFQY